MSNLDPFSSMSTGINPFIEAEKEMEKAGHGLDKIPRETHVEHLWADGLLLWWTQHKKLPTAEELASDMFYEWDDPVSIEDAQKILDLIK